MGPAEVRAYCQVKEYLMNCMRSLNSLFIVLCVLSLALVVCPTITTSAESNGLQAA